MTSNAHLQLAESKACDVCGRTVGTTFVDGKTRHGPWANMCESCHKVHGVGIGTGKGQRYETATMRKIDG